MSTAAPTSSTSSARGLVKGWECGSGQSKGATGDIMGCWNTVVTVVAEQREGAPMEVTSMAELLAPL